MIFIDPTRPENNILHLSNFVFIRKDIIEDTDNRLDKELSSRTGENLNEQDLEELVYENN